MHNSLTHFTKSLYLNGGKDFDTRPTFRDRNSPQVYLHAQRALSFFGDRGFLHQYDRRRLGAASLATKIA